MRGGHVGTVGTTLLLVGGFVAKAGAAGSFEPMTHLMRHLFTTTYTDGDACPDEDDACVASSACLACNEAYIAAFSDCAASLTSASTCDDLADAMCCAAEGCEDNEEFADIMGCINGDLGCGIIDIGDCEGGGSTFVSDSDDSTASTTCPTEIDACNADDECILCTQSYVDAVEGCFASATGSTCDDVEEAVCCAADGCEDNETLSDLLACINEDSTCSIDIGDCAADGSRAISGSDTTADTDSTDTTDTTDTDGTDGTVPFPVGDDQEDEEDSTDDANATDTQNSATPSVTAMGGSTVVWLIAAAAPDLWRRFQ